MTRKQDSAEVRGWSEEIRKALSEDRDLLKMIVEETLQQVLEGEMEDALQAGKSERTETRTRVSGRLLQSNAGDPSGESGVASAAGSARPLSHRGL